MAQAVTERYQNGKATLITQHEREQQDDEVRWCDIQRAIAKAKAKAMDEGRE